MKFDTKQNDGSIRSCSQIGIAASLMMKSVLYQHYPVNCITAWVEPAILLRQIKFFFDRHGHPVGYIAWAFLTEAVERSLLSDPHFLLHVSEWNEGDRLWIIDFLAPTGFAVAMTKYARENMFPSFLEARSVRRYQDGTVRSVNVWRRRIA